MTLLVRRTLAAVATTAALLAIAGCGGDDSADDAAAKPAASGSASGSASEPGEDAGASSDASAGETISGADFADLLRGALDEATTAHMTMDLGGLGSGEGEADYTKTPPELAMTMSMEALGGDIEVRMVEGTLYLKGAAAGGGDGWVSVALDDPSSPLGDLGSMLDPTRQFEVFADAVTEATHVGSEDVDGETLEHYTATVDAKKLVAELPQAGAGQAQLPDTMTQDWWFDEDGLIRRFSSDFGGGMTGTIDLTLDQWGEDVSIEAPPADQVTPMGQGGA